MRLDDRIRRLPRAYDKEHGQDALDATPWATGQTSLLISGAGGSSPYLKGLIQKEGPWLQGAADDIEQAVTGLHATCRELAYDQLASGLRQAKRRIALLTALADLGGIWALETVTGVLTDFADLAVSLSLQAAIAQEIKRGKLPGQTEDDIPSAAGMFALAMGKMGAGELNYSSDIDLICLFDESRYERDDFHEARSALVRATRRMAATLNDLTGEGYVFRTDLRLRPDPSVTPVCMAVEAAERYYESVGRTWERAAYIKARPSAGDLGAGSGFLETMTPFVWRKHLDFASIQDAHDMRLRIRSHKRLHGEITLPGHDMKLGRGGIREIEFFTQTRQLISGGRDKDLRLRGTVEGLQALAAKDWVTQDIADTLVGHYRAHREVEHRVQMINDAQTHLLPTNGDAMTRLACLMGVDLVDLEVDLVERLTEVHALTEGFFAPESTQPLPAPDVFSDSDLPARWPSYACMRSERAMTIFDRLRPDILGKLEQAARPQEALVAFDKFLSGLPAGVQLFSLFEANPQLIDLLVDIVSTSPDLARHLARNAGVFDAVIGGDFFAPWPGMDSLYQDLGQHLAHEPDYERKLDLARRWGKEWHFRIGVHLLRGLMTASEAGQAYSDLAEATLRALFPAVQDEFARKHGPAPGRGAVVLGMGSLGAAQLNARSDLDVIVIYDPDGIDVSDGKKPLSSRAYYARLTQSLITAMTAPMAEGRLYEMDMRLRPSGNQGPVATSWRSFQDYQSNQAWLWEHLALTRARVVAGPAELAADVEAFRVQLLAGPPDKDKVLGEVAQMRSRIAAAKSTNTGAWEAKIGPGRMQEIELMAQAAALISGQAERGTVAALMLADWLPQAAKTTLIAAYELAWSLQIGARLLSENPLDPQILGQGGGAFLGRLTGMSDMSQLLSELTNRTTAAAQIIQDAMPTLPEDPA